MRDEREMAFMAWVALALLLLVAALVPLLALVPSLRARPDVPSRKSSDAGAFVSIVVPARNEAHNLPRLLKSLSRLDGVQFEVLVVDGGSSDGSPDIVQSYARSDPRIRLIVEPPLPAGWVGKNWACWTGRAEARGAWVLFTDADTQHAPDSLRRTLADARSHDAGLLTGLTCQELRTPGERVVMPPVFSLIHSAIGGGGPERASDPDLAIANGQYILFETSAYDALGGHEAVRGSIVEDLALARHAAERGVRTRFVDLTRLVRVRMYRSIGEMFDGWRKNVATGASHTPPLQYATTMMTFGAGALALPLMLVALLVDQGGAAVLAFLSFATMTWRVRLAQRGSEGARWHHAALHPLGYAFFGAVLLASAFDRVSGRGPTWKGRRYQNR